MFFIANSCASRAAVWTLLVLKEDVSSEGLCFVRSILPLARQRRRSLFDSILTGTIVYKIFITHRYAV
jgi:hypothetical protein